MSYPQMAYVSQHLHEQKVKDVRASVRATVKEVGLEGLVQTGDSVAIAVGSRGISQISTIVRETVKALQGKGLVPFIVPAMGSHGGNTPEGQKAVLAHLGITKSAVGAPIKSGIEAVKIGSVHGDVPIFMDKHAAQAKHIVVINRIKPHTKFRGSFGSGLTKMLTIGLGKGQGALLYHRMAVQHTFAVLQDVAQKILENYPVLFGLGVLEDGYNHVAKLTAVGPKKWFHVEQKLLEEARSMMPAIPFDPVDILIIDEIGKEISGIGMDSNVTGRHRDIVGDYFTAPHAKRIFVRNLSPHSDGNGNGIGLADVTTNRLVDSLDLEKTYTNAITAISPEKAALPIHFATDRQCLDVCFKTIGMVSPKEARMVRIKNTRTLDRLWVSKALENEIHGHDNVRIASPWKPLAFGRDGNLSDMAT